MRDQWREGADAALTCGTVSAKDIRRAAETLRSGGLVAFPTETVYGLGADASNRDAVARIFEVKGRPTGHPLIVHVASAEHLDRWAREIPDAAWHVAERCWPGPLTLILKRARGVPSLVTGGQDTIGLRVPGHPVAHALLTEFGGGVAAPSANRFGRISPTTAAHVREDLGAAVDLVLDGGACPLGVESTILDLSGDRPRLLRPGSITPQELAKTLGQQCESPGSGAPRAPGGLASHYAPRTPLRLVTASRLERVAAGEIAAEPRVAIMSTHGPAVTPTSGSRWLKMPSDPPGYARALYARLRELDSGEYRLILVEVPPEGGPWMAVHDRLRRASAVRTEDDPADTDCAP